MVLPPDANEDGGVCMEIPTVVNEALVKDNHAAQVGAVWMTLEVVPDEGKKDNAFLKA